MVMKEEGDVEAGPRFEPPAWALPALSSGRSCALKATRVAEKAGSLVWASSWACAVAAALLLAVSAAAARGALVSGGASVPGALAIRGGISLAALAAYARASGEHGELLGPRSTWRWQLGNGSLGALSVLLGLEVLSLLPLGEAASASLLAPVLGMSLLALLKKPGSGGPGLATAAGCSVGVAAILALFAVPGAPLDVNGMDQDAFEEAEADAEAWHRLGVLAALGAAAVSAVARHLLRGGAAIPSEATPATVAAWVHVCSASSGAIAWFASSLRDDGDDAAAWGETARSTLSFRALLLLAISALAAVAAGMLGERGVAPLPAPHAAGLALTRLPASLALGLFFLGEGLPARALVAVPAVAIAVVLILTDAGEAPSSLPPGSDDSVPLLESRRSGYRRPRSSDRIERNDSSGSESYQGKTPRTPRTPSKGLKRLETASGLTPKASRAEGIAGLTPKSPGLEHSSSMSLELRPSTPPGDSPITTSV